MCAYVYIYWLFIQYLKPVMWYQLTYCALSPIHYSLQGFMSHLHAYTHKQHAHTYTQSAASAQVGHESPCTGCMSLAAHEPINVLAEIQSSVCSYKS